MTPIIVDTNMVLDWLLFTTPAMSSLNALIESQQLCVLHHDFAVNELRRVLTYTQLRLEPARQDELMQRYLRMTSATPMPMEFVAPTWGLPSTFPRCHDSDDQPFLALCYHARAAGVITHDKAILKLRKKARKFSVGIFPSLGALIDVLAINSIGLSGTDAHSCRSGL